MPFNLPNVLTVARMLMIFVSLVLATNAGDPSVEPQLSDLILRYIAFGLAFLAGITDLVDGYLARQWNQVTDFGALMDPLADKVFVTVSMFFLVAIQLIPAWVAAIVICREFMVTGLRTLAAKNGKVISADKLGKLKTFLQMMLLLVSALIWMRVIEPDTLPAIWLMRVLIGGVVVVTVVSGANYFIKNRDLIAEKQ